MTTNDWTTDERDERDERQAVTWMRGQALGRLMAARRDLGWAAMALDVIDIDPFKLEKLITTLDSVIETLD